ncbi:Tn3 family transposase [Streptomyces hygroscopicus]|uniref:Tn3 family transposase n=1 Tax=Streptomyces sp. KHY 26 TaxID=3097359 RepID=UPI0025539DEE|nr:Tn3 family transposase [Streptomyces hygroscopicus]
MCSPARRTTGPTRGPARGRAGCARTARRRCSTARAPHPAGAGVRRVRRIARTERLPRTADPVDATCRRRTIRQLTVRESRHRLARDVCHGGHGTIHQAYRDGMGDEGRTRLARPSLDVTSPWTTRRVDAAVARLRAEGHGKRGRDAGRRGRGERLHLAPATGNVRRG